MVNKRPISLSLRLLLIALLIFPVACRSPKPIGESPVLLSPDAGPLGPNQDALREVLRLVRDGRWNEAREQIAALKAEAPDDPSVARVYSWLEAEYDEQRELALEREIESAAPRSERFNPTLQSVVTDPNPDLAEG
jgi:hypothetical protein